MPPENQTITVLLRAWGAGDGAALDRLTPLVYDELRRMARRYMRNERFGNTLQTTALIHEAYIKLIDQRDVQWASRTHFFAIAAQAMRRILVDYARAKQRDKRGGEAVELPLEEALTVSAAEKSADLLALDEALTRFAAVDEQQARIVELRYFSGLSLEETAEVLNISRATTARDWAMAKAWLHRELTR